MSYTKTNWQTGDVITAEKLNKLESGVEATNPLLLEFELINGEYRIPITAVELRDAYRSGRTIVVFMPAATTGSSYDKWCTIDGYCYDNSSTWPHNFYIGGHSYIYATDDDEYPHPYWD